MGAQFAPKSLEVMEMARDEVLRAATAPRAKYELLLYLFTAKLINC